VPRHRSKFLDDDPEVDVQGLILLEAASTAGVTERMLHEKYPEVPETEWSMWLFTLLQMRKITHEWSPCKQPHHAIQEGRYRLKVSSCV